MAALSAAAAIPIAGWAATGGKFAVKGGRAVSAITRGAGDAVQAVQRAGHQVWIRANVGLRSADSPHNGSVFWSGYEEGNKYLAQDFARRTGGKTVEMTSAGMWLEQHYPYDDLVKTVGPDAANNIWDGVAKRFAEDASGEVNAFIYKMRDNPEFPAKTYMRVERPVSSKTSRWQGSSNMNNPATTPESKPYREFERQFFEHLHRDGPDMLALDALDAAERAAAERALLARIDDPREGTIPIDGLAYLRSRAAIPQLTEIMCAGRDRRAVHAAIALWKIDNDESALQKLCRVVEDRPLFRRNNWARVDAAAMLKRIERPAALVALIDALGDRDTVVDANAKQAMRDRVGLGAEVDAVKYGRMSVEELRAAARTALARLEGDAPRADEP